MTKTTDPRIERVRKMVPDPTTWPGGRLCMKRLDGGTYTEFGRIFNYDGGTVTVWDADHPLHTTYASIDSLIEAGWRVD